MGSLPGQRNRKESGVLVLLDILLATLDFSAQEEIEAAVAISCFIGDALCGMQLFCLQLEASCLQLSLFAYNCVWGLFCSQFEPFTHSLSLFTYNSGFFAYNWASLITMGLGVYKKHLDGL